MRSLVLGVAIVCAIALAAGVQAHKQQKTLVLIDSNNIRSTHSMFFKSLSDRGHELTFSKAPADADVVLQKYGDFFFDNLVLFAPSAEDFGESVGNDGIVKFIDSGRNVLVAVNRNVSEPVREVANDCGIDFDESETAVIDHAAYEAGLDLKRKGDHTVVATANMINSAPLLGKNPIGPVLFTGIGQAAANSPLVYKVLTGNPSSYSYVPNKKARDKVGTTGSDVLLVSAVQTRNNARIVFSGSLDLFSNEFFTASVDAAGKKSSRSGNADFSFELTQWLFQRRGQLRASQFSHKRANDAAAPLNPASYRVKDTVDFSVLVEEVDPATGLWSPFVASDLQLELVMIDPYIRTTLKHDGKGKFSTQLLLPDVYGVYKWIVKYQKQGYSNLLLEQQVSIHPFRHDQFERFIDVAYPYYLSAFSMMAGFFIFGFVFLYSNPTDDVKPKPKPSATSTD